MTGALCPGSKDQEHRGDRRRLPPDEKGNQIAGVKRGNGCPGIGESRHMISSAFFMPAIKDVQGCCDMKHNGKGKAEMIGPIKHHLEPEKRNGQMLTSAGCQAEGRSSNRQQHYHLARVMRHQHQPGRHNHHQCAWWQHGQKITHHHSNPLVSSRSSAAGSRRPR